MTAGPEGQTEKMKDELRTYIDELLGIVLDDSLSDAALATLGVSCVS